MTINEHTTQGQLQLELGKLGVEHLSWSTMQGRHIVSLHHASPGGFKKDVDGFGKSFVEALDDAFTSLVQIVGSELIKAD